MAGSSPDPDDPPRMPRWVKISTIVVGVLLAVFLVLQLTGIAGTHGPGRHFSGSAGSPSGMDDRSSVAVDAR